MGALRRVGRTSLRGSANHRTAGQGRGAAGRPEGASCCQEDGRRDRGSLAPSAGGPSRPWFEGAGASDRRRWQRPGGAAGQPVERYSGAALHGAQGTQPAGPCAEGVARRGQGRLHRHDVRRECQGSVQEAQGLPGKVAAPLPGRDGHPGRGGGAAVHLPALRDVW